MWINNTLHGYWVPSQPKQWPGYNYTHKHFQLQDSTGACIASFWWVAHEWHIVETPEICLRGVPSQEARTSTHPCRWIQCRPLRMTLWPCLLPPSCAPTVWWFSSSVSPAFLHLVRGIATSHNGRDAELTRDDGGVAGAATAVRDDGTGLLPGFPLWNVGTTMPWTSQLGQWLNNLPPVYGDLVDLVIWGMDNHGES